MLVTFLNKKDLSFDKSYNQNSHCCLINYTNIFGCIKKATPKSDPNYNPMNIWDCYFQIFGTYYCLVPLLGEWDLNPRGLSTQTYEDCQLPTTYYPPINSPP